MSRFVAAAAAIALVVCGMVIGGAATYLIVARTPVRPGAGPPPPPPGRPQRGGPLPFTREMEERLNLTPEQQKKIDDILEKGHEDSEAIRRELRPRLEAHLEKTRASIAEVLTPEQRTEFEKLVQEDKRRADRFLIDGPPPGPPGFGPP